ncbi:MAG: cardiolipin synthase [Planctomycetaceae bacterium]
MTWLSTAAVVFAYLLSLALIRWVLLLKKHNPASSVAWIMVIVGLPYVGGLFFLVFGVNRVQRKRARMRRALRGGDGTLPLLTRYQVMPGESLNSQQKSLMRLAGRSVDQPPTYGNRIELLADTNRTLALLEEAIRGAEETIHLEYYIWQPDRTGTKMRDLLIEKAKQGVKVRFLYDKIGSLWLSRKFLRPMFDAGIDVAAFIPGASFRERWSFNLRNHRKIVVVDGRVGFTGGMNIGDEYLGRDPSVGYWRDTHLRIEGPVVLQLQGLFAENWRFATGEALTDPKLFPEPEADGPVLAQLIPGEPTSELSALYNLTFAALNEARERVTLTTSYFVPFAALSTALETAALRGVKVRVLVAGPPTYFWTLWAGRSFYEELLSAGVEIHEYTRGLMHAKTLTIDGCWSLVGTPNFDARSLALNFEVSVAMYDQKIATQLEAQFEKDLEHARRIDLDDWTNRSGWRVLGENACRLFAPVL